ncbi:nuclear factor of activated T-cells, cytoplasmic 3 [Panthera uncia]|uniref:nuclear factor of activated T-cells, cytoplasmic 3 n=1 Tax=Panthera uncia TaxID=29064 RepID=UPI0020FFD017|nr:nuclear factor of activated T-cells, cytoplasmic 3 [Panthera uncia]
MGRSHWASRGASGLCAARSDGRAAPATGCDGGSWCGSARGQLSSSERNARCHGPCAETLPRSRDLLARAAGHEAALRSCRRRCRRLRRRRRQRRSRSTLGHADDYCKLWRPRRTRLQTRLWRGRGAGAAVLGLAACSTSSLPPLDWPLPTHFGQCELKIEVQPKTHHRAHYETEGSRGAVKASTGGHPVVKLLGYNEKPINLQMFIGTADDRYLRPHAFYQVHRITGKTVATASQEIIIASTKVLEIPLLPENNMSASIDCAGILKLRNSDIELRKGETDIGRKNTRVRLVFRVHIPQPNGKVLSLQTASIPVECSQRSAQELPHIEKYSINSCSVNGGHEMIVTGSNFLPESKIIFLEKGQDGRPQWEVEGKIIREKCQGAHIVLEVPPYHNPAVTAAVQVHFYLCNGKRKKSQSQRFTYTPVLMKQEHKEEVDLSSVPSLSVPHPAQTQRPSSDTGHRHNSVLSTQRSLVCPIQQTYASMVTSSHLPQLQCRDESAGKEQHMLPSSVMHQPFQVTPTPPVGSSYQPMQTNVVYNGPTCLPVNAASSQEFDPVLFPQDAALPTLINLGCQPSSSIPFHSSNSGPTGHLLAHTPHSVQTLPHLQSMGYHCSTTGQRSLSSPGADQVAGQPPPQLQPITYGPSHSGSGTAASPVASHPLASSPLSGPPSPQLQPMPYQSPSSGTASSPSLATRMHSGQHSTQAQSTGQGGLSAPSSLICHNLCDPASFPPDEATVNIKPEPEEQEPNFSTIGLQDITLDDDQFMSDLEHQPSGSAEKWPNHSELSCPAPFWRI